MSRNEECHPEARYRVECGSQALLFFQQPHEGSQFLRGRRRGTLVAVFVVELEVVIRPEYHNVLTDFQTVQMSLRKHHSAR